jgi:hypothetical protein
VTDEQLSQFVGKADLNLIRPDRGFWTKDDHREFEDSEFGDFCRTCLDAGAMHWYVHLLNKLTTHWFRQKSFALRVMRECDNTDRDLIVVNRDVCTLACAVKRRGSIPETSIEPEQILCPDFSIGSNPEIRVGEMKPWVLASLLSPQAMAFIKELDSNVWGAMSSAADSYRSQAFVCPKKWQREAIGNAVASIAQHGLIPSLVSMNHATYASLRQTTDVVQDAPSLRDSLVTERFGTIDGIPVLCTLRAPTGEIIVTGQLKDVGVLHVTRQPGVSYWFDHRRQSHNFTTVGDVSILIVNNYAIAKVEKVEA